MAKHSGPTRRITWSVPVASRTRRPRPEHLLFCPGANRCKLQFETFQEAVDYIRWNHREIKIESGRAPTRAYWCHKCCCFHVTSRKNTRVLLGDPKKDSVLKLIQRSILAESTKQSRELLSKAIGLTERLGLGGDTEIIGYLESAFGEIRIRESAVAAKEAEYLLEIQDFSGAEEAIQEVERIGVDPERATELREELMKIITQE